MSQLVIRILKNPDRPELHWQNTNLLGPCSPLCRRLFVYLLQNYNGRPVRSSQLERELGRAFRAGWKELCAAIEPLTLGNRGSLYSVRLPPEATDDEALLVLGKTGKSTYLLRVRDDRPNVWVDAWGRDGEGRNLPRFLSRFVGRDAEIADCAELLRLARSQESQRVLTLTGSPGCGKTRLAVEVARTVGPDFSGRVYFVALAHLSRHELLTESISRILRIDDVPGRPSLDALVAFFGDQETLLVLDNCEAHTQACANVVPRLLSSCPGLVTLATSTARLGFPGETVLKIYPLSVPHLDSPVTEATLSEFSATKLLLNRARLEQRHPYPPETVATLCRRLDGLPLAIEMAAGLIVSGAYTPQEITDRLNGRFSILGHGNSDLAHHDTLAALLDWNYRLLTPGAQSMLSRLSVFVGSVGLETVEGVCSAPPVTSDNLYAALCELVDKSLVVTEHDGTRTRFYLLETIRMYARDVLAPSGEEEDIWERLGQHYTTAVDRLVDSYSTTNESELVRQMAAEYANVQQLLDTAATDGRHPNSRLFLASSLWRFWMLQGRCTEGRQMIARMLAESPDAPARDRAVANNRLGILARDQGDFEEAGARAATSLELFEQIRDEPGTAAAGHSLATALWNLGRYAEAEPLFLDCLEFYRRNGPPAYLSYTFNNLGNLYLRLNRLDDARAAHEESLRLKRAGDDTWGVAYSLLNLAQISLYRKEFERAKHYLAEANPLMEALPDHKGVALVTMNLGSVQRASGEYEQALATLEKSLQQMQRIGDKANIASIQIEMGMTAHQLGRSPEGLSYLAAGMLIAHEYGDLSGVLGSIEYLLRMCADLQSWGDVALLAGMGDRIRRSHGQPAPLEGQAEREAAISRAQGGCGLADFTDRYTTGDGTDIGHIPEAISRLVSRLK